MVVGCFSLPEVENRTRRGAHRQGRARRESGAHLSVEAMPLFLLRNVIPKTKTETLEEH